MIKYAVKYLKNSFYPLKGNDIEKLENIDGKLVLVRTEKGEEVLKAFLVNKEVAELFEKSDKTPEPFEFLRVMSQEDLMIWEELKKEEEAEENLFNALHGHYTLYNCTYRRKGIMKLCEYGNII